MLAIILGILKFIGLLILGVIGFAAAVLLLILLVPVRYRAHGFWYKAPKGKAEVSWLLHILSCQVQYDGEPDMCVRVFGIRLGGRKRGGETKAGEQTGDKGGEQAGDQLDIPESGKDHVDQEAGPPGPVDDARKDNGDQGAREAQGTGESRDTKAARGAKTVRAAKNTEKKQKFSFRNPFEKIRVTFRRICGKLKTLKDKKEQVLDFLSQEENKNTFRLLKQQIFALIRHILPGKIKGHIRFGFDDPYTTGQVLTWISPFYGFYAKKLQLVPVFDEKVLEGELDLRGRIRLGTLVVIALRMFLDKNFRKLLKKWREA